MNPTSDSLGQKVPDPQPGSSQPAAKIQLERRQELEHIVRANPNDADIFLELATIYLGEHRPLEAKRVLDQAQRIFPKDDRVLWHYEEAVLARALQQFREANDLASRVNSSEADQELEKSQRNWVDRRIEVCRARLGRDPSLLHLRVVLGEALLDGEQFEEAIQELEPLREGDELAPQVYFLLGRCELALGHHAEAMKLLRHAVMRREVPANPKIRVAGLRLLCETAAELGVTASMQHYRELLETCESELANSGIG